jgi:putative hydrolase of the HAD superfamily
MLLPNGIRAILFDLDGTLRYNQPSAEQTFFNIAADLGLTDTPERRRGAMRWAHRYWAQSETLLQDQAAFGGQSESFWTNYLRRHLISFECPEAQAEALAPELSRQMNTLYQPEGRVDPQTYATLGALQAAGFRLGLVSNRSKPCVEELALLGLDGYFEYVLAAGEVGCWKPNPGIFTHALAQMGLAPEQAVYVGDNYYADIVGAQRAGMQAVLVDPEGVFPEAGCRVIARVAELSAGEKGFNR